MVRPRYEYTYDEFGNQETIRDNVYQIGGDIFYDHDGNAIDPANPPAENYDTRVTKFSYDDQGRQKTRTLPLGVEAGSGFVETNFYDDFGRVAYEVSFESVVTGYVYDDADGLDVGDSGRLVAKHYYDNATAADVENEMLGTPDETVAYEYDARGRIASTLQEFDEDLDGSIDRKRFTKNVYDDTVRYRCHYERPDIGRLHRQPSHLYRAPARSRR